MDSISFLYFDDIDHKDINNMDGLKVLWQNGDDHFRLSKMPYIVLKSIKEFQSEIGQIIYLLDPNKDKELFKKYASKIMHLEFDSADKISGHLVAGYDNESVCVKRTHLAAPTYESSFRFVRIKDMHAGNKIDKKEIYFLKINSDDTISITPAPVNLKKRRIPSYEAKNNGLLVVPIEDDYSYDESKVIKLEETENVGKYRKVHYEKPKQIVKKKALK